LNKKWVHSRRLVIDQPLAKSDGLATPGTSDVDCFVNGLSSELTIGIYVVLVPSPTFGFPSPATLVGAQFQIFPWIADAFGAPVRSDQSTVNNGGVPQQLPGAWEGSSTLEQVLVDCQLTDTDVAGTWKLIVVIEPLDPAMPDDCFEKLASRVGVGVPTGSGAVP
jgi:hypothetical protein